MVESSSFHIRRSARDAARVAASRGFLEEPSAWTLQYRCVLAALRCFAANGALHDVDLVREWLPGGPNLESVDFDTMPDDRPLADLPEPWPDRIDELLDDHLTLPDEGWDEMWRKCGIAFRTESHRVVRRLDPLRGWNHDRAEAAGEVPGGDARASGEDGVRG